MSAIGTLEPEPEADPGADPGADAPTGPERARLNPLAWASALYLLLPLVIFAVMWLRPLVGLVVLVGVGAGVYAIGRPARFEPWWWLGIVLGLVVAALWVYASGIISDATIPTFDWAKHTALLGDLVRSDWPAVVRVRGNPDFVRYYVAWYLPPALAAKHLGIEHSLELAGLWSAVGYVLVIAQVVQRFPKVWSKVAAAVGFVLFSGLDVVGASLNSLWRGRSAFGDWSHLENWADALYKLESNTVQVLWLPQHAIPCWLGALLLFDGYRARRPAVIVLAVVAALLWSPFIALGLAPFAVVALVRLVRESTGWKLPSNFVPVVLMAPAALVFAVYLSAAPAGIPSRWAWDFPQAPAFPWSYLQFLVLEVLVLFGLAAWIRGRIDWTQWTALAVLVVAPMLIYGQFNDLARRVSAPGLLVLCLMVLHAAFDPDERDARERRPLLRPARLVLWFVLAVAAVTPVVDFVTRWRFADNYRTPIECSLADDICSGIGKDIKVQYLVPVDDPRLSKLLKPPPDQVSSSATDP